MSIKKQTSVRRKRFKRNQRLYDAKIKWLPTAAAKNVAKSYGKWYGVDLQCAISELEMLGHTFTACYKEQVKMAIEHKASEKRRCKEERDMQVADSFDDDETFSYIAGYTESGIPFGVTYEEEQDSGNCDSDELDFRNGKLLE